MAAKKSNLSMALATINADLVDLRTRRLDLLAEIEALERAPLTKTEIEVRVDRALDLAADSAREGMIFGGLYSPNGGSFDFDFSPRVSPLGVLCVLGQRETVKVVLVTEAMREAAEQGGKPIGEVEREAELHRLRNDLRDTEMAEESVVRSGEDAGLRIARRSDADPAIFLLEEV